MTMEPNNEDDDIIFPSKPKRVKTYQAETINSDSDEKEGVKKNTPMLPLGSYQSRGLGLITQ